MTKVLTSFCNSSNEPTDKRSSFIRSFVSSFFQSMAVSLAVSIVMTIGATADLARAQGAYLQDDQDVPRGYTPDPRGRYYDGPPRARNGYCPEGTELTNTAEYGVVCLTNEERTAVLEERRQESEGTRDDCNEGWSLKGFRYRRPDGRICWKLDLRKGRAGFVLPFSGGPRADIHDPDPFPRRKANRPSLGQPQQYPQQAMPAPEYLEPEVTADQPEQP